MSVRIGWYVHHHGNGHATRLRAIAASLVQPGTDAQIECFSSLPRPLALPPNVTWTVLPRDDGPAPDGTDPRTADPTVGGLLHWAPIGHAGHRERLATLARALERRPVDVFVVDVSVEVTLFVRLLGVRTVVVAQPGDRSDDAHRLAYRAADVVIAPWPRAAHAARFPAEITERVVHVGGISRHEGRTPDTTGLKAEVLVLGGAGGTAVSPADIAAAERASGRSWRRLGAAGSAWVADPWPELTAARVVVSWAGQNAVADLAAAGARAVVIPQDRPFSEQTSTAAALERAGLAVVSRAWPAPHQWPALLRSADELRPEWSRWQVDGAAHRAATVIAEVAHGTAARGVA